MIDIKIETIPHEEQNYETVGDWKFVAGELKKIFVSDMDNRDYEFMVGVHELIEAYLCERNGITQEEVDEFDMWYEEARDQGVAACGCKIEPDSEPGFDKHAPYLKEHSFATKIERMLAHKMKVDWTKYENKINTLYNKNNAN